MKYFALKRKRIALGLLLAVVILVGVAMPASHAFAIDTGIGAALSNLAFVEFPNMITNAILTITSWILGMTGYLLNTVIQYTIVDMTSHIANINGINVAWKVFRDLANLSFIFILLNIAIRTILGVGGIDTKKALVNVIIIALLLNFSLFFTKIMVDASNIVTLGFYNKIVVVGTGNPLAGGLSGAFMNKLGVSGIFDVNGTAEFLKDSGPATFGKILLFGLFGGGLFLITAFVFIAAAVMFIVRYVTLIFLMFLSPLAFAAMALPHDDYSDMWWKRLMKNIIFAPIFMVLVWATLTILGDIFSSSTVSGGALVQAINNPGGAVGLIMNFAIVIAMMLATLMVANELGDKGTSWGLKHAKIWRGKTTSFIGRNTLGRAGANLDKKLAKSTAFGGVADSRAGRFVRGYTTGALAESKFGGDVSRKADVERIKKERTDIANNRRINELRNKIKNTEIPENLTPAQLAKINPSLRASVQAAHTTYQDSQREILEKTYQKMSNKELENLGADDLEKHVQYLSPSQLEHVVEKSDKFNEQEKESIKNARFAALKSALDPVSGDPTKAKGLTKALSDKEIEILDSSITTSAGFIKNLSQGQIDSILKSQKFTSSQKKRIRDEIIRPLQEAVDNNVTADIAQILGKMKATQIAKLDTEKILLKDNVIAQLTPKMMTEMSKELESGVLKQIGDKIRASVPPGTTNPTLEYITNGRGRDFFN